MQTIDSRFRGNDGKERGNATLFWIPASAGMTREMRE